ncbi:MAG: S41 family peptidase [Bacteroidales bacterium]
MKLLLKNLMLLLVFLLLVTNSCKKNEDPSGNNLPDSVKTVNEFIYQNTIDYYLWNEYIPAGIDINDYPDPYELFDAMYYPTLDYWSFVTDDYQGLLDNLNGIQVTEGYIMQLYKFQNSNDLFGIIEYVYEGGPAANAGMKRGDVVLSVNGQTLNINNYTTLIPLSVKELGLGAIEGNEIVDKGITVTVTSAEMNINPVLQYSVLEKGAKKIGYFLYDQFTDDVQVLEDVMNYFKGQNITDLVLDLRFNSGGYATTCDSLAAMMAPSSAIGSTFLTQQWNDGLTAYLIDEFGSQSDWFISKFPVVPVNLNLSRLYVLTSGRTASASESLVNGLAPYMDVFLIGDRTAGKYTGAWLLNDEIHPEDNWGLYLVTSKLANANGATDFVNGFTPDYEILDDYITPLGDENELLFAKAISLITDSPVKSVRQSAFSNFQPVDKIYRNNMQKQGIMVLKTKN